MRRPRAPRAPRKRNPQDATLRNIRAMHRRMDREHAKLLRYLATVQTQLAAILAHLQKHGVRVNVLSALPPWTSS